MLAQTETRFWITPTLIVTLLSVLLWLVPLWLPVRAAYLWTDYLIFVLVAVVIYMISYIRTKPHLLTPWRKVFQSQRAMASAVLLSGFILIGLLDSLHFQKPLPQQPGQSEVHYSVEILSVFDVLTTHLRERVEKTYSAPMAIHLFAKESMTAADGSQVRDYPRLDYGGAHLDNVADMPGDVLLTALQGMGWALLIWAGLIAATVIIIAWTQQTTAAASLRQIIQGKTSLPLLTMLLTAGFVLLILGLLFALSTRYHVFGTDKVGQDVFYLSLKSIRTGLVIGTLTTLVMLPFAIALGIMAGYFRGWIDDAIQYLYTTLNSIPGVLLIAAAILSIQVYIENHPELFNSASDRADLRLLALCVILGITSWTGLCRLLRGEALKLREMDYIQAATAFGVSHFTILARHILPNVIHIVLIVVVLDFSGLVLAEAVLSYVGVGVDPSTVSWGNMINGARLELAREPMVWWSLVAAFILMFALVLSANLFADAVRDAFDPRIKQKS